MGLGVKLDNRCETPVTLSASGWLRLTDNPRFRRAEGTRVPSFSLSAEPASSSTTYVPILFDNEDVWNRGLYVAMLILSWSQQRTSDEARQEQAGPPTQSLIFEHVRSGPSRVVQYNTSLDDYP
jgi:hypothetical protein